MAIDFTFEYYTFLHHSQTNLRILAERLSLNTIRFYIILKLIVECVCHIFRLNTIRFYIILKPCGTNNSYSDCLNTIRFYIILKQGHQIQFATNRLNTIRFYIILKLKFKNEVPHTHIRYSIQTVLINRFHIHLCQLYNNFPFLRSLFVYFQ